MLERRDPHLGLPVGRCGFFLLLFSHVHSCHTPNPHRISTDDTNPSHILIAKLAKGQEIDLTCKAYKVSKSEEDTATHTIVVLDAN